MFKLAKQLTQSLDEISSKIKFLKSYEEVKVEQE